MKSVQTLVLVHLIILLINVQSLAQENLGNRICYEIALLDKMIADEHFMISEKDSALFYYKEAENYIKTVDPDGQIVYKSYIELLNKDINYKQQLIKNRFDFYGVSASGKPHNPIRAYQDLKTNIESLKNVYNDISTLYENIEESKDKLTEAEAKSEWNNYQQQTFEIDESRLNLLKEYQNKVISQSKSRMSYIHERQKELDNQSTQNRTAISNSVVSLNETIIQGIKIASGLPPELSTLDPSGSLEDNMMNIGIAMIYDENSPLFNQFGEVSKELNEFRKIYYYADSIYSKLKDYEKILKHIDQTLKKPTFDKLMDLGGMIYQELPPAEQQMWKTNLIELKPMALLLDVSNESQTLKSAIINELSSILGNTNEIEALLIQFIDANGNEAKTIYLNYLKEINNIELKDNSLEIIIETIIRNWPKAFLDKSNIDLIEYAKLEFGVANIPQLCEKLNTFKMEDLPALKIENGILTSKTPSLSIDLKEYLNIPSENTIESSSAALKNELTQFINDIGKAQNEVLNLAMKQIPVFDIEIFIGKYFTALEGNASQELKNNFFTNVIEKMPTEEKNIVFEKMVNIQIGSEFFEANASKSVDQHLVNENLHSKESEKGNQLMNMAFSGALTYLSPGVAIALNIWNKVNEIEGLVDKQNKIVSEFKQLTVEQLQLEDKLENARVQLGVSQAEQEVAILMQKASREQYEIYNQQMAQKLKYINKNRAKISIRLGYYYYIAEILRRNYYVLDKSLQTWFNTTIFDMVQSNPQNARFSLDQDILLFNWLDRNIETQRGKLDSLTMHWDKIGQLINDNCDLCKENSVTLLSQQTETIKISEVVPNYMWNEFLEWKKSMFDNDFKFYFSLTPSMKLLGRRQANVRILMVRIAGVQNNQGTLKPVPIGNKFSLEHLGMSWVFINGKLTQDYMVAHRNSSLFSGYNSENLPQQITPYNWPRSFNLDELQIKWSTIGGINDRPFEGYGFYANWELELENSPINKALDDVYLRFAYHYVEEDAFKTERDYDIVFIMNSGLEVSINKGELETIGNQRMVDQFLSKVTTNSDIYKQHKIVVANNL